VSFGVAGAARPVGVRSTLWHPERKQGTSPMAVDHTKLAEMLTRYGIGDSRAGVTPRPTVRRTLSSIAKGQIACRNLARGSGGNARAPKRSIVKLLDGLIFASA